MAKYDYNVLVIGGGTAGLISAYTANLLGGKVALVEGGTMGGDCLNTGCVPSKTLIASAHAMEATRTAAVFGVSMDNPVVDYAVVHKRIHDTIDAIAPNDSAERYRSLGIDVYENTAEFVDGHTVQVKDITITARRIVVATGARPGQLAIPGADLPHVYSSDTIWKRTTLPKNLVVIGAGPIGCELAMAYAQLGCRVTLVEPGKQLLTRLLSPEQAQIVAGALERSGVSVITNGAATKITDSHVAINGQTIKADCVLIAVGRQPNTEWLANSGLQLDEKGYLKVDRSLRTSISSIYACGDVTGGYQFTHVAAYEASFASSNTLIDWVGIRRKPAYNAIPWVLYTTPEVAHVGIELKRITPSHSTTYYQLSELDRSTTDGEPQGGMWLVVDKKGRLVGATIIATQAASLLGEATLAIRKGLTIKEVYGTIHAYPSYGELYSRTAGKYRLAHTNPVILKFLKRINRLAR